MNEFRTKFPMNLDTSFYEMRPEPLDDSALIDSIGFVVGVFGIESFVKARREVEKEAPFIVEPRPPYNHQNYQSDQNTCERIHDLIHLACLYSIRLRFPA